MKYSRGIYQNAYIPSLSTDYAPVNAMRILHVNILYIVPGDDPIDLLFDMTAWYININFYSVQQCLRSCITMPMKGKN